MSIWSFGAPFVKSLTTKVGLDTAQLDLIKRARVDDLSLVNTISADERNWKGGGAAVAWSDAFRPGGLSKGQQPLLDNVRGDYISRLVEELHARGVQVLLGYTIGNDPNDKRGDEYCRGFTNWLASIGEQQVRDHAKAVSDFVVKYDADGIGFDLEITSLGAAQKNNLGLLYASVCENLKSRAGIVSYATAPFTAEGKVDGVDCMAGIQAQPFAFARDTPNLIARPMCYDTLDFSFELVGRSVEYALGAAGLKPWQIQMGIYGGAPRHGGPAATQAFVAKTLGPRRMGMVMYQVPAGPGAVSALGHTADFEKALNPGAPEPSLVKT